MIPLQDTAAFGDVVTSEPEPPEIVVEVEAPPGESAEPPADYEKAFHELFAHAEEIQGREAALRAQCGRLEIQADGLRRELTDVQNHDLVVTTQLDTANAELVELRARVAEADRDRVTLRLYGVRVAGDRADRMVLADDAGHAASKVAGAERIVLVSANLVW